MRRLLTRAPGFTMIETLAAFLLVALMLAAVMPRLAETQRRAGREEARWEAQELGLSLLDEVGEEIPLSPDPVEGSWDERFRWRIEMTPAPEIFLGVWEIEVVVHAADGEPLSTLSTLRREAAE